MPRILFLNPRDIIVKKMIFTSSKPKNSEIKLAKDICFVKGQINPIIVEEKLNGSFELISGLRRLKAALTIIEGFKTKIPGTRTALIVKAPRFKLKAEVFSSREWMILYHKPNHRIE